MQVSQGEIEGLWRSVRSPDREISLAFAFDNTGFISIVEMDDEAFAPFAWTYEEGRLELKGDLWFSVERVGGKLTLAFEDGNTESLYWTSEGEVYDADCHEREVASWRRWSWTVRQPNRHESIAEAAMVELPAMIIGTVIMGQALTTAAPTPKGFMLAVALLPTVLVLIFREFYSNSPAWWRLCPEVRRFAAVIYFGLVVAFFFVASSAAWYRTPGFPAIAWMLFFGSVVCLCGWSMAREIRGVAGLRFEGLDR